MSTCCRRNFLSMLGLLALEAGLRPSRTHAASPDERIRSAQTRLYAALDDDRRAGRPLVATVLVNLTYYGKFVPVDRNMYWAGRGGYSGYFRSITVDKPAPRQGTLRWKPLDLVGPPPLGATTQALFHADGAHPVLLAVLGFSDGPAAMRNALRAASDADAACVLRTDALAVDAFQDARLLGFAGHNPAFDVAIPPAPRASRPRTRTVATFAIGCCTGGTLPSCAPMRVAPHFSGDAAVPLLFSDSLMTGEAFSFQAMLAALIDRLPLPRVVDHANDEYQRVLSKGGTRHGRPFTPLRRLYAAEG